MPNRLVSAASPYLLQHAENPVDWLPWGEEAFELARLSDKPIFLSVGYSSCHWCHVMAHESFEDVAVAALLNEGFVCVKVDREERPDVDEAYMAAVQIMSGRGGWPMSVFMTPDRRPFLCGTYWPKDDRGGQPGFKTICASVSAAWDGRRQAIEQSADQVATAIREAMTASAPAPEGKLEPALIDKAVQVLMSDFDQENGGFGTAPKFPPHTAVEFLLRYAITPSKDEELQEAAISMAMFTLRSMCLGGIHDHVGGGFHRYSTDEVWLLPHFEKTLYDNALILGNLAQAAGIASQIEPGLAQLFTRSAQNLIDWVLREMTGEQGLFYSALDADSEGEEGKFYVWTVNEVTELLKHHAPVFMESFGFQIEGNFEDEAHRRKTGANIPHLKDDLGAQFEQELEMLRVAREERVRPGLDDKSLVGWNGLMMGALADAGMWPLAQNAAVGVFAAEKRAGSLPHQISRGTASGEAFLEDYAYFIQGLLKLAVCIGFFEEAGELPEQAIPSDALVAQAARLAEEMVAKFYDEQNGGFYGTSDRHEILFGRTKPVFDQPLPSANSVAIRCLIQLGDEVRARKSLDAFVGWMERAPQATEGLFTASLSLFEAYGSESLPAASVAKEPAEIVTPAEAEAVATAPASAPKAEVAVKISGRELVADKHAVGHGVVTISIPDGFHLNSSTPPARWLTPTKLEIQGVKAEVEYPDAVADQYKGQVEIPFAVHLPSGESGAEFEVTVSYQACTESECLAPAEKRFDCVVVRG